MDWIDRYCTSSDLCCEDKNDQHLKRKQQKYNPNQAPDAEQTIKKIEKALENWKQKRNGSEALTVQMPVVSSSPLSPSESEEGIPSTDVQSKPECGTKLKKQKRGKIARASSTSRLPLELLFPQPDAQFGSSLPVSDDLCDEVEHFEFDLAKMKEELGLLDVNSAPLSPIHSPIKERRPAMDESKTLTSHTSDQNLIALKNNENTITSDLDFASETNDSVRVKEPFTHTSAEGLDNSALDSVKRKRPVKTKDPLQSDSLCAKRRKVSKSISNTRELTSSELQLTGSTDFVSRDSSNDSSSSDVCQSKDNFPLAPFISDGLQSSHRTAKFQVINNNNNSVHLNLNNAFETPSQCVSKTGVDFSQSVDLVVTAVKEYNIHLGHSLNMQGMLKKKQGKNIQKEKNLIENLLDSINCSTSEDSWTKQAVRSLTNLLINPKLIPDKTSLLFQVFWFVCSSKVNIQFSLHHYEEAILTSLYKVDQMKKLYLTDLLTDVMESLHLIIVNKPDMNLKGLSSFCKMYTEICRERNLERKPILLSVDLLKAKPKYAPVMIASIVGVWSEPFQMTEATSDEEKCLLSAVSFGALGKRKGLMPRLWESCVEVLSKHITPAPDIEIVEEVIGYLFALIHLECTSESPRNIEQTLLAPVIIFAAFSPWEWTKGNILDKHVVPSLLKYEQLQNETAYGLFSDLYAEIFSFCPGKPENCVLKEKFEGTAKGFVKDCAALALIRLLVLQKKAISRTLVDWLQESALNSKIKSLVPFLKSKKLTLNKMLIKEDVLI